MATGRSRSARWPSASSSGGYASQRTAAPGDVLRAIAVPELELAITELMPPAA